MVMTPRGLFLCRTLSTAGLLPLLPTSRNGTHGFGWAEPLWNSYSCDPSIAVLQSVPAFLLSQASVGPRSSGEVARQQASARSNQRFVNSFLCLNVFFAKRQSYVHICGFNVAHTGLWTAGVARRPQARVDAAVRRQASHIFPQCR